MTYPRRALVAPATALSPTRVTALLTALTSRLTTHRRNKLYGHTCDKNPIRLKLFQLGPDVTRLLAINRGAEFGP